MQGVVDGCLPRIFRINQNFVYCPKNRSSARLSVLVAAGGGPALFGSKRLIFIAPSTMETVIRMGASRASSSFGSATRGLTSRLRGIQSYRHSASSY